MPDEEIDEILAQIWQLFGGGEKEGPIEGYWIDGQDGRPYHDRNIKISVECDPEREDEVRDVVRQIGQRLGQKKMAIEIRDSRMEFIDVD